MTGLSSFVRMGSNEPPARSSCRGGSGDKGLTSDSDIHGATRRGASGEGANAAAADGALLGTAVGRRVIALVGMMGSGKTSIGKRLATRLGLPFVDSDSEIETAAGMTITEIFDRHGEAYFREGERRVIARLLGEGPCVLATGGGAFMDAAHPRGDRRVGHLRLAAGRHGDLDATHRAAEQSAVAAHRRSRRAGRAPARLARAHLCARRPHRGFERSPA